MQDSVAKSKKGASKDIQYDRKYEIMSFYLDKGETIFAKLVKKYSNVVGLLKLTPTSTIKLKVVKFKSFNIN